ncbi:MAG: ATP-binding cassette domain-containing protein, partial [Acidimicrobiia bacterium]|nr:ATP-binding cassette domain-containing protein [Acidimicrobiia bacterium]
SVDSLTKTFRVPVRESGLAASVRSLFNREFRHVEAVKAIDFTIEPGEIVGFLGPNGAGKTTTLKMLTGLLYPTSGSASVLDHDPSLRERELLKRLALIMGNRNNLNWDLPALDSYELQRAIYEIPKDQYASRVESFVELLDLGALIDKPVRNLSLGERMKVEIGGALLHHPEVLFLDEPTLGLDVTMQQRIRTFIKEHSRKTGATVMLTSHYMADIVALCERVIVIHHGRIIYDGALSNLADQFAGYKTITVTAEQLTPSMESYGSVMSVAAQVATVRVARAEVSAVARRMLQDMSVLDISIAEPPIEDVIADVFDSSEPET